MKKVLLMVGGAFALSLALVGCASTNTSQGAYAPDVTVVKEYKADIAHQNAAVSGEATVNCLFGVFVWGVSNFADDAFVSTSNNSLKLTVDPNTVAKQGATYNACAAAKSDMLIGAQYKVDTMDYFVFKTIKCKATGFPGVLKGIK